MRGAPLNKLFTDTERSKNIVGVSLTGSKKVTYSIIILLHVNYKFCYWYAQFQSDIVETLVSNCHNLEVIMLSGLKQITDTIALAIAHYCPNIQHISLRNCNVTDLGICELATHCLQLSFLALSGVHNLTDKSIIAIAENCAYLEDLYISGCEKITKQAVTYLKVSSCARVLL